MIFRRADNGKAREHLSEDVLLEMAKIKEMVQDLEYIAQHGMFFLKDAPYIADEIKLIEHSIYMFRKRLVHQSYLPKQAVKKEKENVLCV